MKKTVLSFLAICIAITTMQAQNEPVNPFEEFGYKPKIATLSKGKYVEFYDQDTIVQIGGAVFNTVTMKIMGFVEYDTIRNEYNISPEVISRWLSPDPLTSEFPSWSPYNFVENNPIRLIDPTGLAPNDYTVDDKGIVTDVKKTDDPNRFFDTKGNELFFHDQEGADKIWSKAKLEKGDRVFFSVTNKIYSEGINKAGVDNKGPIETAIDSYSNADFSFNFLAKKYPIIKGGTDGDRVLRSGYPDQAGYFRFENEPNKIYNLFDAGNHMWGYWMGQNQWSLKAALRGANINEGGDDTKADQEAIKNGFNYSIGGAGSSW